MKNKNRLLLILCISLVSLFLVIRNRNVYHFRMEVIGLVMTYNEHHTYSPIRSLNQVIPGYYDMVLSIKPLKYEYWISKEKFKQLTESNDILI